MRRVRPRLGTPAGWLRQCERGDLGQCNGPGRKRVQDPAAPPFSSASIEAADRHMVTPAGLPAARQAPVAVLDRLTVRWCWGPERWLICRCCSRIRRMEGRRGTGQRLHAARNLMPEVSLLTLQQSRSARDEVLLVVQLAAWKRQLAHARC